jgi:hypothetical protein
MSGILTGSGTGPSPAKDPWASDGDEETNDHEPIAQSIEQMTYLALQTSGDASNQPGSRRYW